MTNDRLELMRSSASAAGAFGILPGFFPGSIGILLYSFGILPGAFSGLSGAHIILPDSLGVLPGAFTGYQRELCAKYKVHLIPKQYFSWVITGAESTVDGLHLSNIGQQKMAQVISRNIK